MSARNEGTTPGADVICVIKDFIFALDLHQALALEGLSYVVHTEPPGGARALIVDADELDEATDRFVQEHKQRVGTVVVIASKRKKAKQIARDAIWFSKPIRTEVIAAFLGERLRGDATQHADRGG